MKACDQLIPTWWDEEDAAISWDDFWEVGINFWADD